MSQSELDQLKRVEEKLDYLIKKLDEAEEKLGFFLTGPGRKLAKLLGVRF